MASRPKVTKASAPTDEAVPPSPEALAAGMIEEAVSATVAALDPITPPEPAETGAMLPVPALAAAPVATASAATPMGATPAHNTQQMEKLMKNAEEFLSFSQGNMEAMMKSGQIWAAGVQDLSKQFAATAQSAMEETVSTFKAMSGVKSLKEAMDLQAALARSAMEKAMTGSGMWADASFKLAEQTLAPLTARFQLATSKLGTTV